MLSNNDLGKIREVVKEELKPTNRKINKVQRTLDATIRVFDDDITYLKRRTDRVESVLSLSPLPRLDLQ